MSESAPTATPPVTTTVASSAVDGKAQDTSAVNATGGENEMTERNLPVNDPPVTGASSMQMPPLIVKHRGVAKPGVQPTAGSVSFDYSGPPVKVTNGTVMDLVTQFGIQNAWLAVLKLRGFTATKETAETILPIKRFRDRVRKLKQTAETLKSRSDNSATFFAKEFLNTLATGAMDTNGQSSKTNAQSGSGQKESSSTDAVIESILRQAVNEENATQSTSAKPKRKKNNKPAPGSSTIDDVVSSVMNKIRNNEPFEGEERNNSGLSFANIEMPYNSTVHQQPHQQMLFAPQPGQTIYMVQDESMIPLLQQQHQGHIAAPPPPPSPPKGKTKGRKNKAAAAAAAAAASQPSASQIPQQQVVQVPNYLPQQQIPSNIRSPTSMPQQVTVLTVPRGQQASNSTSYSIPAGYSTAKFDNNTTVIFSNINDLLRAQQTSAVPNQQNQITKVVAYQPGMTLPPGATLMSSTNQQGMSPPSGFQQMIPQQPQQSMQPQYIVAPTPVPQAAPSLPKPQPQAAATEDKAGESGKKSPRRKSVKSAKQENVALQNFNDSDFEELATPTRKDALKKAPKKEKKAPAEKKAKTTTPKTPAKKTKKKKGEPQSEGEEEEEHNEVESSDADENKSQLERENAQLKRQLQAERSRHYTQKRRATKLDDDYKRVLDRLQQTELNLALQMSECERLQAELKKMSDENVALSSKVEGGEAPKTPQKVVRSVPRRTSALNRKQPASPSPSPAPGTSQKKAAPKAKATPTKAAAPTTTNNRKRGRPAANAAPAETSENKQSPPSSPAVNEEDKPAYNASDFIPRRAAAAKRIRYF